MTRPRGGAADLFARPWTFLRGITRIEDLPPPGPPEIAFAGRSNVGKSSLINAVLAQKSLARTSNRPGRTQELNIFIPETDGDGERGGRLPSAVVVDMPGYGYAAAPKAKVAAWTELVFAYLRGRPTLKRVFLLVDARHGLAQNDRDVLDLLDRAAVSYQVVLTKSDKPKAAELSRVAADTREAIGRRPAAHPTIIATSAQAKTGIAELRQAIGEAVTG